MPYVRVTMLHLDPTKARQIMRFTEEQLIPRLRRLPGFRRYTSAGDLVAGHAITIAEWDTLEQAQTQLAAVGLGTEIDDFGLEIDAIYVYQVTAQA
jgi:hypothetical protein